MKALILNSGVGNRMGALTQVKNKCLVEIAEGITIIDHQLRTLLDNGVRDFCITTGPFAKVLEKYIVERYPRGRFSFVRNDLYEATNYIYSIYLAREQLRGDLIMLHGDLLFDRDVLGEVLTCGDSVMTVDYKKPLPEKDFKAVVIDGRVRQVGVQFFDGAYYGQPLYKLSANDWAVWLDEIIRFCEAGETRVYAENALNQVSDKMRLLPFDLQGRNCFEVDNPEDLEAARKWYIQAQAKGNA